MNLINFELSLEMLHKLKAVVVTLIVGYLLIHGMVLLLNRVMFKKMSKQTRMLLTKGIVYAGIIIIGLIVINVLELKGVFATLLGAAGVLRNNFV